MWPIETIVGRAASLENRVGALGCSDAFLDMRNACVLDLRAADAVVSFVVRRNFRYCSARALGLLSHALYVCLAAHVVAMLANGRSAELENLLSSKVKEAQFA